MKFNRFLSIFRNNIFARSWFNFGLFVVAVTKLYYFYYFSFGVFRLIRMYVAPFLMELPPPDTSLPPTMGVLVPGVHLPIADFIPMTVAALIVMAIHELGHAIASEAEGVGVSSFSFYLHFLMPVGAIEMNTKKYAKITTTGKLRILSAGVFHNIVFAGFLFLIIHFWSSDAMVKNLNGRGYLLVKENRIRGLVEDIPSQSLVWEVNGRPVRDIPTMYEEEINLPGICVDKSLDFMDGFSAGILRANHRSGKSTEFDCCSTNRTSQDPTRLCFTSGSFDSCLVVRKIFSKKRCDSLSFHPNHHHRHHQEEEEGEGMTQASQYFGMDRCKKSEICVKPKDPGFRLVGFLRTLPNDTETNSRLIRKFELDRLRRKETKRKLRNLRRERRRRRNRNTRSYSAEKVSSDVIGGTTTSTKRGIKEEEEAIIAREIGRFSVRDDQNVELDRDVLYYGHISFFYKHLKLMDFIPRYGISIEIFIFFKKLFSFFWVMTVGFALLNLPPISVLDGEKIFYEIERSILGWVNWDGQAWPVWIFRRVKDLSISLIVLNISALFLGPLFFS